MSCQPLAVQARDVVLDGVPADAVAADQAMLVAQCRGVVLGTQRVDGRLLLDVEKRLHDQVLFEALASPCSEDGYLERAVLTAAQPDLRSLPSLSVAICTAGIRQDLREAIASVMASELPAEILVVDNSVEPSDVARMVQDVCPDAWLVKAPVQGLNRARNAALQAARTELVAFLDDDAVADRNWTRAICEAFAEEPELAVLTGLVLPYELKTCAQQRFERYASFTKGFDRRWWEDHIADHMTTDPAARFRTWEIGTGANMAVRRDKLIAVGGFNTALDAGTPAVGCGDLEMFFRAVKKGLSLRYEPGALVWHRHRREKRELQAQVRGFGSCAAMVITIIRADLRETAALPKLLRWYRSYFSWRIRTGPTTDRWLFMHELAGYFWVVTAGTWLAMRRARLAGDLTPSGQERLVPRCGPPIDVGIAIDLREPQPRYFGVPGPSNVRVKVRVGQRELGEITVKSGVNDVSFAKIRAAIAREFGLALVSPRDRATVAARLGAARLRRVS